MKQVVLERVVKRKVGYVTALWATSTHSYGIKLSDGNWQLWWKCIMICYYNHKLIIITQTLAKGYPFDWDNRQKLMWSINVFWSCKMFVYSSKTELWLVDKYMNTNFQMHCLSLWLWMYLKFIGYKIFLGLESLWQKSVFLSKFSILVE